MKIWIIFFNTIWYSFWSIWDATRATVLLLWSRSLAIRLKTTFWLLFLQWGVSACLTACLKDITAPEGLFLFFWCTGRRLFEERFQCDARYGPIFLHVSGPKPEQDKPNGYLSPSCIFDRWLLHGWEEPPNQSCSELSACGFKFLPPNR